jgi:hypothetical protein
LNTTQQHHANSAHALSEAWAQHHRRLMVFNWLVASYAHRDWLGSWAELMGSHVEVRLLRRASEALLKKHNLMQRYLRQTDEWQAWLLLPANVLEPALKTLGVAMLGGWVRNHLEREQVAQQLRVLGPQQRAAAMGYASSLKALPYPQGKGWPVEHMAPPLVHALGVSCLAALLNHDDGSKERFLMRFAPNSVTAIELTTAQKSEALTLLNQQLNETLKSTKITHGVTS